MQRIFALVVAAFSLAATGAPAQASHIFSTNIQINGTPVASVNAFTNPTITVNTGDLVTFSFDLFSEGGINPDMFNVSFASTGGTLPAPADPLSFAFDGTGTQAMPVTYTFTRTFGTPGVFVGNLTPDFPSSFPDYQFPGGNELSEPQIPFSIQVNAAPTVPEPASLAVFGLMGVAGMGYVRRRFKGAPVVA